MWVHKVTGNVVHMTGWDNNVTFHDWAGGPLQSLLSYNFVTEYREPTAQERIDNPEPAGEPT